MDERAFENMAVSLRDKAIATCLAWGADSAQADDVAQDVLLRLWQMRQELDRYRSLDALVTVMARNALATQRRKDHSVSIISIGDRQLESHILSPDDSLISSQEVAWLNETIRKLPSTQYAVLHMRQVQHLSYDTIARKLGIENSTARSMLSRARINLLNEIKKRKF